MRTVGYNALTWDTQFFGFPIGAMHGIELSSEEVQLQLATIIQSKPCRLLYIHVNPEDTRTRNYLKQNGAQLVDDRIVFRRNIDIRHSTNSSDVDSPVETYAGSAGKELDELALLAGQYSRFRVDPKISETDFQRLYTQWIKRSVSGAIADKVLITRDHKQEPASLITLSCKDDIGIIGLLAVRHDQQGKGLGLQLVDQALNYFSRYLCATAEVATQGTNIAACKFYEKLGFIPFKSSQTYHMWLPFTSTRNN